jgi:post-segregation antitoxin (ccd killing protein)
MAFCLSEKAQRKNQKNVRITLSPYILTEAREHNLNIIRITEQALTSILEYLAQQNKTESSINFLNRHSFSKDISQRKNRGK